MLLTVDCLYVDDDMYEIYGAVAHFNLVNLDVHDTTVSFVYFMNKRTSSLLLLLLLKKKQKEIAQIEAEWSKAQHDVIRAKIAISDNESDMLAREQTKNKALALCMENGKRFKYNAPVSSQEDVNKMYNKIQRLSEQDQLSIMRREVKFKKLLFSDLPSDFKLFRQHNISAKIMYQNLLQLHAVDESNQETIFVEDIRFFYLLTQ